MCVNMDLYVSTYFIIIVYYVDFLLETQRRQESDVISVDIRVQKIYYSFAREHYQISHI